ncbi:MAG: carboxypeptidase-like regulatory domain-containing protein [Planctomycetota bacterium]
MAGEGRNTDLLLIVALVAALGAILGGLWAFGVFDGSDDAGLDAGLVETDEGGGAGARRTTGTPSDEGERPRVETPANPPVGGAPVAGTSDDAIDRLDSFGVAFAGIDVLVRDPEGLPVGGAEITVFDDVAPGINQHVRGDEVAGRASDHEGFARFEDLRGDGAYIVLVRHEGYRDSVIAPITLLPGRRARYEITLQAGLRIFGRVLSDPGESPLPGARVVLYDTLAVADDFERMIERSAVADADGNWSIDNASPGPKRIVAMKEGWATDAVMHLELGPEIARLPIEFRLSEGREIRGRVLDPDGRGIVGATVSARFQPLASGARHRHLPPVKTDELGRYVLGGLVEGFYTVRAEKTGYRTGTVIRQEGEGRDAKIIRRGYSMLNANAGDRDVDLMLLPAAVVVGRVVDDRTGLPVKAFEIAISNRDTLVSRSVRNTRRFQDEEGRFEFSSPILDGQTGPVWLFALAPGFAGGSVRIDVAQRVATEERVRVDGVEIRVKQGGTLRARIVDTAGRPVPGARVIAYADYGLSSEAESIIEIFRRRNQVGGTVVAADAQGVAVVPHLLPANYRLRVEAAGYAAIDSDRAWLVEEGGEADAGKIEIYRGGRLHGVITDPEGRQAEGVIVRLRSLEIENGETYEAQTGIAGAYEFLHVRPGRYRLTAARPSAEGAGFDLGAILPGNGPGRREPLIADGDDLQVDLDIP